MHTEKEKVKKGKAKWASDKHTLSTVKSLKSLGLTNEEMATIFGFKSRQLRRLQENHPEFRQALVDGKANLHDRLVAKLVVAATGYDYDEVRIKKDSKKKIVETITTTRHQPASASLLIFLMTNQWGDPTERWKGWRVQRDSALPGNKITIHIDGKTEAAKISKLAGKLFGENSDEPARKSVVATEVSDDADGGHRTEKGLLGTVSTEAPDSVQVNSVDI